MPESIILKGALGINNKIDPLRHQYNPETGVGFLAEAVDCDIDDSGMISRRLGQEELSSDSFLCTFCDKGDCFVVQDRSSDAALMQVGTDLSLTGIRSGLTKSVRPSFYQVGDKTYYSSSNQNGVITNGISTDWPDETHLGRQTNKLYYPAPLGQHIAYIDGHMLIAQDNVIWISEKYEVGKFRMKKNLWQMGTYIRMIRPVLNGVWISDQVSIGFVPFLEGKHISEWPFMLKSTVPAHEWSDNIELVTNINVNGNVIPGNSLIWSSDDGMCIGSEDGQFTISTEDKLFYSTGDSGATIVDGNVCINSVW